MKRPPSWRSMMNPMPPVDPRYRMGPNWLPRLLVGLWIIEAWAILFLFFTKG